MLYKRKGEMQTRSSKRQKPEPTMVVYRGVKPEMKHCSYIISHSAVATSNRLLSVAAGTGIQERVGNKVKVHHVEVLFGASGGLRVSLLLPNDASAGPSLSFTTSVDRDRDAVLYDKFFHNNTTPSSNGAIIRHKLPMGIVQRYASTTAASVNSGSIYLCLNTPAPATVTGYVRIWYTDA